MNLEPRLTSKRIIATLLELSTIKRIPIPAAQLASACGTNRADLLRYVEEHCPVIEYNLSDDTLTF